MPNNNNAGISHKQDLNSRFLNSVVFSLVLPRLEIPCKVK